MGDSADTVKRVLRGERVSMVEKVDALADIAASASVERYRLAREVEQLREALTTLIARDPDFGAREEDDEIGRLANG